MGPSSFKFVQWALKDASMLQQRAFWPFKVIQGYPRSIIFFCGGALFLQGIAFARKGGEVARKGIFKERPHNSHPCEFARNGLIQEIKKWNPQGTAFARKGICTEWTLQGMRTMLCCIFVSK